MKSEKSYFEVIKMLPPFENMLKLVPINIRSKAIEIRIRAGNPLVIETSSERYICGTRMADINEIYTCIKSFCDYSIHSCQKELSEGWITLKGGHRAGFTGTAFIRNNILETIKDISSINIRIANEHIGISDSLFRETVSSSNFRGLIIAGAPLSGKTTFLRDFCRNLGTHYKTALIDERGEIAAVYKGVPQNNVGMNTDVLNYFSKEYGFEQAIRVLSPEFVVCDEIGSDISAFSKCTASGVKPILSIHCGNIQEALLNNTITKLFEIGTVNYLSFLGNGKEIGKLKGLWCINDGKNLALCNNDNNLFSNRQHNPRRNENESCSA